MGNPQGTDTSRGDDHAARISELTKALRKDPARCPNCGGGNIGRIEKKFISVSGERKCRDCGCLWSPGWSKLAGLAACLLGLALGITCVVATPYLGWQIYSGRYFAGDLHPPSTLLKIRVYLGPVFGAIGAVVFLGFGIKGLRVLLGRRGQPEVLEPGERA